MAYEKVSSIPNSFSMYLMSSRYGGPCSKYFSISFVLMLNLNPVIFLSGWPFS